MSCYGEKNARSFVDQGPSSFYSCCTVSLYRMHRSMTLPLAYLNNRLQLYFFTTINLLTKEHMALFVLKPIVIQI